MSLDQEVIAILKDHTARLKKLEAAICICHYERSDDIVRHDINRKCPIHGDQPVKVVVNIG